VFCVSAHFCGKASRVKTVRAASHALIALSRLSALVPRIRLLLRRSVFHARRITDVFLGLSADGKGSDPVFGQPSSRRVFTSATLV